LRVFEVAGVVPVAALDEGLDGLGALQRGQPLALEPPHPRQHLLWELGVGHRLLQELLGRLQGPQRALEAGGGGEVELRREVLGVVEQQEEAAVAGGESLRVAAKQASPAGVHGEGEDVLACGDAPSEGDLRPF
jgi:hypothetical protein